VAITLGANHSGSMRSLLVNGASEVVGVTLIAVTILVCYRYADRMLRALGATGTSVLVRLSAFILLCIGVQILWNGVSALAGSLPLPGGTDRAVASPAPRLAAPGVVGYNFVFLRTPAGFFRPGALHGLL